MSQIASKIRKIKNVVTPFARFKPTLKPVNDISAAANAKPGCWTATGDDPQFLCEFPKLSILAGWYMFTLDIEFCNETEIAKLYVNTGSGFIETESIKIPYQSGMPSKRLVKIPRNSKAIRFDPLSCEGEFSITEFSATPVTFRFAETRMLKKLVRWNGAEQFTTVSSARQQLKTLSKNNGQTYQSLLELQYSAVFSSAPETQSYSDWIATQEVLMSPDQVDVDALVSRSDSPMISVLLPTYNTDSALLEATIQSVVKQRYNKWQLCISDGGSSCKDTVDLIKRMVATDTRISATYQSEQTGISKNTNCALALATGQYCVFLDHDDLLAEHALYEVAKAAFDNPSVSLIYSDEDKLDNSGQRVAPHFKPNWNPDLLLSQNYICHLVALKKDLLTQLGGCREGYDGAQDHDLLLRVMQKVQDNEIFHIPKILYHWRMIDGSTAATADAKSYTTASGVTAIQDYLSETGANASVCEGKYANTYRVSWHVPTDEPLVSIIIPTRDRLEILSQCINSVLAKTDYSNYEIIIVDNESCEQQTLDYFNEISKADNITVLPYAGVFNFSAINNFAVDRARGSVITMMNNDIEVINQNWLREMVGHALRPSVGCVGAKLLYKNNMVQHAGVILGIGGVAGHAHKYFDSESAGYFSRLHLTQNMSAVTAACLTVRKSSYKAVCGFNEDDLKVAFNDVDFCLRVSALGLRNVWSPYALLYHHESLSRGLENTAEKQARFSKESVFMRKRWGDLLNEDPAYNPNLTLVKEDFSLAA